MRLPRADLYELTHFHDPLVIFGCAFSFWMSQFDDFFSFTAERPESWCKTLFSMLPKKRRPLHLADFRPIANIRSLFKTFAYLLLGRLEHFLEAGQPEEQHGFRPGRRLEEHLVTANLVLDKADAVGIPVWIVSLDLSKAFDQVHWPALWTALVDEGIPVHLVWI